ncbi:amidohydrolase family protein [Bacillus sp. 1P06AnD]|uniref:amidohydrolase family protein n=1 Tax=Bacillus sp. 1P06AnD TaxID=3132208 RepID=UPI0039A10984
MQITSSVSGIKTQNSTSLSKDDRLTKDKTIFDAHIHIIDPSFPLIENQGYIPDFFTCEDYLHKMEGTQVIGGAIVSGSFQGYDQTYFTDALEKLGPQFVGVTQIPFETSDHEILKLDELGIRAIRFNLKRGGSESIDHLDYMARRVFELAGWHTELYSDAALLEEIQPHLEKLPALSIDHLGLTKKGFKHLLSMVDRGIRVKATGFGRIDFDPVAAIKQIVSINPDALMFGTDLPSTRAARPYEESDLATVYEALSVREAENVLCNNALKWYLHKKRP